VVHARLLAQYGDSEGTNRRKDAGKREGATMGTILILLVGFVVLATVISPYGVLAILLGLLCGDR
jgi:hypothetical protein